MFEFFYKKNNNISLFKDFENKEFTNLDKCQNYVPIYSIFFSLNDKNWNSINLNNSKIIQGINAKINENKYNIQLKNGKITKSFFKFSPLIDPIKYMYGKYKAIPTDELINVPMLKNVVNNESNTHLFEKITRKNNVSYVDSFFYYLSSKIKQEHRFLNGTDFYGSFLGIKNNFELNIYDDLEYLTDSEYFYENTNKLFKLDDNFHDLLSNSSRKNKRTLEFNDDEELNIDDVDTSLSEIVNEIFDNKTKTEEDTKQYNNVIELDKISLLDEHLIFEFDLPNRNKYKNNSEYISKHNSKKSYSTDASFNDVASSISSSDCSTTSSKTTQLEIESLTYASDNDKKCDSDDYNVSVNEDEDEDEDEADTYSTISDEIVTATINSLPVQVICIENMTSTLDDYMSSYDIHEDEWKGILLQIIFTLITYQKAFDFTHNDLHTNNIMFIETEEEYIYYKYKHEYFKVPTFGKIWKIIDYGRAIYKFKGKQIVSDSYHKNEDAGTQYNFGEYYNPRKPIIEPNNSFDLCRLSCSLFDYFFNSINEVKDCDDDLSLLIAEWCTDDNNYNILYKNNGRERYPGFKLYKMIARNVHKHSPETQLSKKLFANMRVKRRVVNKSCTLIDIDRIPSYKE
jgi:hypothetical protein